MEFNRDPPRSERTTVAQKRPTSEASLEAPGESTTSAGTTAVSSEYDDLSVAVSGKVNAQAFVTSESTAALLPSNWSHLEVLE